MKFYIDAWSALAPGLDSIESWRNWLQNPEHDPGGEINASLKTIPPMVRRRFRTLGKCAVGSALPILNDESIPSIFVSRHGDTPLTISLLEDIALHEPMSPTAFSLAVHNAVGGLFSIARKDISEITSIAAMEAVVFHAICEALGQLQNADKLLCVIHDVPLAEFFGKYLEGEPFPWAIALIISNTGSQAFEFNQPESAVVADLPPSHFIDSEPFALLKLLTGLTNEMCLGQNKNTWQLKRVVDL